MSIKPSLESRQPMPPLEVLTGQTPLTGEDRLWGMLPHVLALASYALAGLCFIGPLLVYIFKREQSAFIGFHIREALNFNISLVVYTAISLLLARYVTDWLAVLLLLIPIFGVAMSIVAAVHANRGELFRYPLCVRFLK